MICKKTSGLVQTPVWLSFVWFVLTWLKISLAERFFPRESQNLFGENFRRWHWLQGLWQLMVPTRGPRRWWWWSPCRDFWWCICRGNVGIFCCRWRFHFRWCSRRRLWCRVHHFHVNPAIGTAVIINVTKATDFVTSASSTRSAGVATSSVIVIAAAAVDVGLEDGWGWCDFHFQRWLFSGKYTKNCHLKY